jgi:hypothetical protein
MVAGHRLSYVLGSTVRNAMIHPTPALFVLSALLAATGGCGWHAHTTLHGPAPGATALLENPLFVPIADREFLWLQVVDTVDNYFNIKREERVRLVGDVLLEGRIETFPAAGSTMLEPWRKDSTPGFEKLHATLQSVRRYAIVRVAPTDGGYLVDVAVHKELEDVERPEHATVAHVAVRHDSSLVRSERQPRDSPVTWNWIPVGRDASLEQRILSEIWGRVTR